MIPGPCATSGYPRRASRARVIAGVGLGTALYAASFIAFILTMGSAESRIFSGQQIDDPSLLEAIDRACAGLQGELEKISARDAERVRQENSAVERFVDRVKRSTSAQDRADDTPTEDWLDDWLRLVAVRDSYAQALDQPAHTPPPITPREGDTSITVRMESAEAGCAVPGVITDDLAPGR